MPRLAQKSSRRQQILEALARMLEESPGERITTAGLASAVGVSEAALYRHFPSKAKMFEGLIDYVEEVLFSRIANIISDEAYAISRLERISALLLGFAEKNPGISRIMNGDALAGETERVRGRVAQLYDRLELQIKQVLRDGRDQRIHALYYDGGGGQQYAFGRYRRARMSVRAQQIQAQPNSTLA